MSNCIVVNKLNLEKETVGYRIDILDSSSKKIVSVDITEDKVKSFLKMIGSAKINKGVIIPGKIVNGLFITGNDDNIIEVKTKAQANEILNKYFFNSDDKVEGVLNSINSTESEVIKNRIRGDRDTLGKTEYGECRPIQSDYNNIVKALKGINNNLHVNEYQDKSSGELVIDVDVLTRKESLKIFHSLGKAKNLGKVILDVSSGDRKYVKVQVDFNDSFKNFSDALEAYITDTIFEVVYDKETFTRCYCEGEGYSVFYHSIPIPGYNQEKYLDRDELLKEYNLV